MKKKIISIFVCMLVIGVSTVAVADWDEGDGHKMHWPQLPDPNGWDVFCTSWSPQYPNVILADDWECSESGNITEIHFWGSWLGDNIGQLDYFLIGIAENIPPEQNPHGNWSMPGETLIEWDIYDWVERGPYTGNQGWYWCYEETNPWHPNDHQQYWQYNVFLDEEDWFWQEEGTIYWLYITAIVYEQPPEQPLWGWKSTLEDLHFMDDAVWAYVYLYDWLPLTYPSGLTMDLAFVVTGGEECEPSIDVEKYVWDPDNADWVDADTESEALKLKICTDARFKIVIHNNGECCDLYDITVNDKMEDSLKFLSADPEPDEYAYDPPYHYMTWNFPGPLPPCNTIEIIITAHVEGPGCSTDFNYVQVVAHSDCDPPEVIDEDYAYVHAKKGRSVDTTFLNFLQQHPYLFPILRLLLQRLGLQ